MRSPLLLMALPLFACTPQADQAPPKLRDPEREISADNLFAAWAGNKLAAERDFTGTPLRIIGNIAIVDEDVVMLRANGGSVGLRMIPGQSDLLIELQPGASFSADCEKSFFYDGTVLVDDCRPASDGPVKAP